MRNHVQAAPSIRFKGFADAWEQRKLGEVTNRITRKNTKMESTLPLTISAQHGLVNQVTFFNKQIASKNISGYYLLKQGEFAYNKSYSKDYPWGAVKRLDKYDNGVLSTLYIVFELTNIDSGFLVSYYDTNNWHKEISVRAAEGARNHGLLNITAQDFFDTDLLIPTNNNEQTKIGAFFKQLDTTITLQQQQLDNYREWKKALLQKMFPKDGEKRPEVRFEGFTGEWEERKVKDIFPEIFSGNRLPKTLLVEGEVPYIIAKVSNNGEFMKIDDKSLDYHGNKMKLFPFPSITFSIDNPEAIFVQKHPFFTSNIMRVLHNSSLSYNQNIFFHLCIKRLTTYFNWSIKFSGPVVMDSIVYVPINDTGDAINFDEVERVGAFFKQLDDTITLHQQQLDNYKELKKAMLQKMFI